MHEAAAEEHMHLIGRTSIHSWDVIVPWINLMPLYFSSIRMSYHASHAILRITSVAHHMDFGSWWFLVACEFPPLVNFMIEEFSVCIEILSFILFDLLYLIWRIHFHWTGLVNNKPTFVFRATYLPYVCQQWIVVDISVTVMGYV